jgi:E3 ubiquitin-protein ligase HUWE1
MGKALYDGYMLDAYFTPAFYKQVLEIPISYKDMEEEDYVYYKSLKWILENSPIEAYMQLSFTYDFDHFGELKTENLVPNGDKIQVTEENKLEYVQLISHARMAKSVE